MQIKHLKPYIGKEVIIEVRGELPPALERILVTINRVAGLDKHGNVDLTKPNRHDNIEITFRNIYDKEILRFYTSEQIINCTPYDPNYVGANHEARTKDESEPIDMHPPSKIDGFIEVNKPDSDDIERRRTNGKLANMIATPAIHKLTAMANRDGKTICPVELLPNLADILRAAAHYTLNRGFTIAEAIKATSDVMIELVKILRIATNQTKQETNDD